MSVLIIAEHNSETINPNLRNCIAAAKQLAGDIHVLVAGHQCEGAAAEAAALDGPSQILLADDAALSHQLAEELCRVVRPLAENYTYVVAAATTGGKNLIPRLSALLDVQAISDVSGIDSPDTFKRPIYAGNVIATVKSLDAKKVMTLRTTSFDPVANAASSCEIVPVDVAGEAGESSVFVEEVLAQSDRPELTAAQVVISGGRGLQNGDNFSMLYTLADKLGAAVGASRAAVDAGFVPNDMQVGQTGKIVAPDLYIAVGISGAIQHLAGMKESKIIVAINKDEDAPIFGVADYGLVADLFDVLPELIEKL